MDTKNYVFTSESVTEGHPDKIADQISDAILDEHLRKDPNSRVACETLVNTGLVVVAGEITSKALLNYSDIVRGVVNDIGYDHTDKGFDYKTCSVLTSLDRQSEDISIGVDEGRGEDTGQGAGDQGLMFGYAIDETPELMPYSIAMAHKLSYRLAEVRKSGVLPLLRPDGKTQVSVEYQEGKIAKIRSIVVSSQHAEEMSKREVHDGIYDEVIKKVIPQEMMSDDTEVFINPTGKFVIGGPMGDCGLTGRKIIVDTYGGHGAHGGGAFSGKDPSKVDRSAAYAARQVAKHVVAAGLAKKALVQVAYAIGISKPVSFFVNTFGTHTVDESKINQAVNKVFDMRPKSILSRLDLLRPIYRNTAAYGHFGRQHKDFKWEALSHLEELKSHF